MLMTKWSAKMAQKNQNARLLAPEGGERDLFA
jgi:hypothetical protein